MLARNPVSLVSLIAWLKTKEPAAYSCVTRLGESFLSQGTAAGKSQSSDRNSALSLGSHGSPHGIAAADGCGRHTSAEKGGVRAVRGGFQSHPDELPRAKAGGRGGAQQSE